MIAMEQVMQWSFTFGNKGGSFLWARDDKSLASTQAPEQAEMNCQVEVLSQTQDREETKEPNHLREPSKVHLHRLVKGSNTSARTSGKFWRAIKQGISSQQSNQQICNEVVNQIGGSCFHSTELPISKNDAEEIILTYQIRVKAGFFHWKGMSEAEKTLDLNLVKSPSNKEMATLLGRSVT